MAVTLLWWQVGMKDADSDGADGAARLRMVEMTCMAGWSPMLTTVGKGIGWASGPTTRSVSRAGRGRNGFKRVDMTNLL